MPKAKEPPLLVALRTAMDHARPVRGKDEVALRSVDWHAIENRIRDELNGPGIAKIERAAEAMWQAESMRAASRPRAVSWESESEDIREKWRGLAIAAFGA